MTTKKRTYVFGYSPNGYFQSNDGLITRDDGQTIKINSYDGHMAFCVKDHQMDSVPSDTLRHARDQINEAEGEDGHYGLPYSMLLYDVIREDYWHWLGEEANEHGFDNVFSAGRSSGWAVVHDTTELANNFLTVQDPEAIAILGEDVERLVEVRNRFLEFAFDAVEAIESFRQEYYRRLYEEYQELENARNNNIRRGDN